VSAAMPGGLTIVSPTWDAPRTGSLAGRERVGLIGNGPTYLAPDTGLPHMPNSERCRPAYLCAGPYVVNGGCRRQLSLEFKSWARRLFAPYLHLAATLPGAQIY
jgi:hypothetical protein